MTRLDGIISLWSNNTRKGLLFWAFDLSHPVQQWTFSKLIVLCDKWIMCKDPAQWLIQEQTSLHYPNPNSDPEKLGSQFVGLMYWFLDPSKTWHLRSCLGSWWDDTPKAALSAASRGSKRGVSISRYTWHLLLRNTEYLNKLSYEALPHPAYSPDPLPTATTFSNILTNYWKEKTSIASKVQKFI